MAKEAGFPLTLSVDDSGGVARDISNDVSTVNIATPRAIQDVTGLDRSAVERLLLLADFTIQINGNGFNDAANRAHAVFKTVPSTSVVRTTSYALSGQTLVTETLYSDYSLARGQDGGISWSATGALADGAVPTWS